MDIEVQMRNALLTMARGYAAAAGVKLSTVGRKAHGDPPIFANLAKRSPVGFTVRKFVSTMKWLDEHWPEGAARPVIDPITWPEEKPHVQERSVRRLRR